MTLLGLSVVTAADLLYGSSEWGDGEDLLISMMHGEGRLFAAYFRNCFVIYNVYFQLFLSVMGDKIICAGVEFS